MNTNYRYSLYKINDYDNCIHPSGMTSLFLTAQNVIDATNDYGKKLADNDFDVNAIIFIITDGMDNASGNIGVNDVSLSLKNIMKEEALESIMSILIGINEHTDVSAYLDDFKDEAGLNQYIEIKNANNKTLAKLADFISKSVSSQSQSLGSGSMSQPLNF